MQPTTTTATTADEALDLPSVSVVVPVRDGAAALALCLAALTAQTYPGRLEVVVVDDGSTEDLAPALPDDARFRLVRQDPAGSYAARNTALAVAGGAVCAFTDGDCVPEDTWVAAAVEALRAPTRVDMVGGAVRLSFRGAVPSSGTELYEALHSFPQERYLALERFAVTANMVVWRSSLDAAGLFDARLQSRGDAEFGQRLARGGGSQRYAPAAVVRHPARASWSELATKLRRVSAGRRDQALREGARWPFFARLAAGQGAMTLRMVAALAREPRPAGASPATTAAYAVVFVRARVLQAVVYGRAAVVLAARPGSATGRTTGRKG